MLRNPASACRGVLTPFYFQDDFSLQDRYVNTSESSKYISGSLFEDILSSPGRTLRSSAAKMSDL